MKGEALDSTRLLPFLEQALPGFKGPLELRQFSGGASNWTYGLRSPTHDLVLRRPPAGTKARSAHDMGREYRIQAALKPVFPLVPTMVLHHADPELIGAEFYLMERVDGIILRKDLPEGLVLGPEACRKLAFDAVDLLAALHRIDIHATGLDQLGKGVGYVKRQVEGWSERYRKARTWNVPEAEGLMRWLSENQPSTERICFTHNDWRFDNLVLDPRDPSRIVGVLDWELAALGDPLMDLGNALAYWVQADDDPLTRWMRRQPTHLPGMPGRAEVVARYGEVSGLDVSEMRFYEVFGLFRLAGIAQQIYLRYHRGESRNTAFRFFWVAVNSLIWRASRRAGIQGNDLTPPR